MIVSSAPADEMRDAILDLLLDYNDRAAGPSGYEPVAILLRDPQAGTIVGGLWGQLAYDWLFVELLVVAEPLRGLGHGSKLLREAERIAVSRDAVGVWLDTYSFQARGFYEKLGYALFGELPDHPRGGARYFMRKIVAAPAGAASRPGTGEHR